MMNKKESTMTTLKTKCPKCGVTGYVSVVTPCPVCGTIPEVTERC